MKLTREEQNALAHIGGQVSSAPMAFLDFEDGHDVWGEERLTEGAKASEGRHDQDSAHWASVLLLAKRAQAGAQHKAEGTLRFAVLDVETTGLDLDTNEMIELGATILDYSPSTGLSKIKASYEWMVNPERPIPPAVSAISHIIDEDVFSAQTAPVVAAEAQALFEALEVDAFIAHNAPFDQGYVTRHAPSDLPWVCSKRLARHVLPEERSHSLQTLRYSLRLEGIDRNGPAHRALFDVSCTVALFRYVDKAARSAGEWEGTLDMFTRLSRTPALLKWTGQGVAFEEADWQVLQRAAYSYDEDVRNTAAHYMAEGVYKPRPLTHAIKGKHKGKPFSEIPDSYLEWMAYKSTLDNPDEKAAVFAEIARRRAR